MASYIIQVICFQALFLVVYYALLRKETFFIYNRIYLLVTPILALVIPFVKIVTLQTVVPVEILATILPEVVIGDVVVQEALAVPVFTFPWLAIYVSGVVVSVLLLAVKVKKFVFFLSFKKKGEHIVEIPNTTEAFTFFNYIFIGKEINPLSRKQILRHEQIHAKQGHTWDLILFEILRIFLWFNPLVYVYQKCISIVHEYLADQQATATISKMEYYEELLNTAFGTTQLSFTNTFFNKSLIKNRIIMLQKSKSKRSALVKYTFIIPLILGMLVQVSWAQTTVEINSQETSNFQLVESKSNDTDGIYMVMVKDSTILSASQKQFLNSIKKLDNVKINDILKNNNLDKGLSDEGKGLSILLMMKRTEDITKIAKTYNIDIADIGANEGNNYYKEETQNIPFAVIEKVPVFPGCDENATNEDLKVCMSNNVSRLVNTSFNTGLGKSLGLKGVNRIFVSFRINKLGQIDNVRARAPHPELEQEALRVIYNLPDMDKPGQQKGENVGVLYSLPITFSIAE